MPLPATKWLLIALFAMACDGRDPEIRVADLTLRLPRVADCQPMDEVSAVVVQALGDFPPSDENTIDVLRPSDGLQLIDRFPPSTRIIGVRATAGDWTGVGARILDDEDVIGPLLLVQVGRSCPLADFGEIPSGARAVALPDGGVLVVGGRDDDVGSRRILRLDPGVREGLILGPDDALDQRRVGHEIVPVGDRVLIVGGAPGAISGPADDRWEIYDIRDRRVTGEEGTLLEPRTNFAATALPDGRVLIAGGRSDVQGGGTSHVERIDPRSGTSEALADLRVARWGGEMVTLDDGAVVLIGGVSNDDAPLPQPVFWDPATETLFQSDDSDLLVGRWDEGLDVVPLEGGRVAVVGDGFGAPGGRRTSEAVLLRHLPSGFGPPRYERDQLNLDIPDLANVRGTQLDDGRLLVTGRDASGNPRAFAFSIGAPSTTGQTPGEELDASRVPDILLTLADGLIAELAPTGASLRREGSLRTFLHNAGATVLGEDLALDGPGRWEELGADLTALEDGARADVPTLRFADVLVSLDVADAGEAANGDGVEVLLRPMGGGPVSVVITERSVSTATCRTGRAEDGRVSIERRGDQLRIDAGEGIGMCNVVGLTERIGIGFRASDGASLQGISVNRL